MAKEKFDAQKNMPILVLSVTLTMVLLTAAIATVLAKMVTL